MWLGRFASVQSVRRAVCGGYDGETHWVTCLSRSGCFGIHGILNMGDDTVCMNQVYGLSVQGFIGYIPLDICALAQE